MRRTALHMLLLGLAVVCPLLFFADKAFHMDDTLFVWTAKQILSDPFDFYGFSGN